MARPTYAEEFENLRGNINKVVVPNDMGSLIQSQPSEQCETVSSPTKIESNRASALGTFNNHKVHSGEEKKTGSDFDRAPTVKFKEDIIDNPVQIPQTQNSVPMKSILSPRGLVEANIQPEMPKITKTYQRPVRHQSDRNVLDKGALQKFNMANEDGCATSHVASEMLSDTDSTPLQDNFKSPLLKNINGPKPNPYNDVRIQRVEIVQEDVSSVSRQSRQQKKNPIDIRSLSQSSDVKPEKKKYLESVPQKRKTLQKRKISPIPIEEETSNENSLSKHNVTVNMNSSDENQAPPFHADGGESVLITHSAMGQSVKTKYFVSNYYVEKIFDDLKLDQDRNMEKIQKLLDTISAKLDELDTLKAKDFPELRESVDFSQKRITKVIETQIKNYNLELRRRTLSKCFECLAINMRNEKEAGIRLTNLIKNLRRYQTYHCFRKFALKAKWEAQLMDKNKIEGAYLLLKRFKNRLKTFDTALEKVYEQKADRQEFIKLKQSLDKDRALSIFNDMKILFDTTVKQLSDKLSNELSLMEDRHSKLLRDQKLVMIANEKKYTHLIKEKILRLETLVNDLSMQKDLQSHEQMDGGLFPRKLIDLEQSTERKIRETFLEKKIDDLRTMILKMKQDHDDVAVSLQGVLDEMKPLNTQNCSDSDWRTVQGAMSPKQQSPKIAFKDFQVSKAPQNKAFSSSVQVNRKKRDLQPMLRSNLQTLLDNQNLSGTTSQRSISLCNETIKGKRLCMSPEPIQPSTGSSINYRTHTSHAGRNSKLQYDLNHCNIATQQIQALGQSSGYQQRSGKYRNVIQQTLDGLHIQASRIKLQSSPQRTVEAQKPKKQTIRANTKTVCLNNNVSTIPPTSRRSGRLQTEPVYTSHEVEQIEYTNLITIKMPKKTEKAVTNDAEAGMLNEVVRGGTERHLDVSKPSNMPKQNVSTNNVSKDPMQD